MDWLEDFLKGVGQTGSKLLSGTGFGQRMAREEQRKWQNRFDQAKMDYARVQQVQDPKQRADKEIQWQNEYQDLVMSFENLTKKAYMSGQEQRSAKSYKSLTPEEKKRWSTYGGVRSQGDVKTKGDRMVEALERQAKIQKARDVVTDEKGRLTPDQEERFRQAFEAVNEEGGFAPTPTTPKPGTQAPTTEIGRRAQARYFGDNVQEAHAPQMPTAGQFTPVGTPRNMDIRGYFVEGVNPFEVNMQEVDQAPKTLVDMGLLSRDTQQRFEELQKAIPDVDLREEYQRDPDTYKRLFDALKTQKLTTQEVIALIRESLAQ